MGAGYQRERGFQIYLNTGKVVLSLLLLLFSGYQKGCPNKCFPMKCGLIGGANTRRSVTVLVAGDRQDIIFDRFPPEWLTPKFSGLPAWMFHGVIYNGRKALGTFWEKDYGTMNSAKYDAYIL